MFRFSLYFLMLVLMLLACGQKGTPHQSRAEATLVSEFIYKTAPFPECHASTIAETPQGLVAAWFGGTEEKHPDVGIWASRRSDEGWSAPVEVANGEQENGLRYPCWNPVLFQQPDGALMLFYKVGPNPRDWWGMLVTSDDAGNTWNEPQMLPKGILGPIKNKPELLTNGNLLCPSSTESRVEGWRVHMEWTPDWGSTWFKTNPLNRKNEYDAIQPAILIHNDSTLQILCRSRQKRIAECWSKDGGRTWTPMKLLALPNPSSGIDAVTLANGKHLLVYNPTEHGRSPLNLAMSGDGLNWHDVMVLEDEPGEYSYPAIIQSADGHVHITYTWKRERIRYVELDPEKLMVKDM